MDTDRQGPPTATHTTNASSKPAGWRLVNFTRSTIQPRPEPQHPALQKLPTPGWSAVQHDFEQRLSRFGITVSDTKSDAPPENANETVVQVRPGLHDTLDDHTRGVSSMDSVTKKHSNENFPLLKPPTLATFTNKKRESRLEDLEKQVRQAQVEAEIWKAKCEAQEQELQVLYGEVMKWRMEYEDLYSAIIRDQQIAPPQVPLRRHGTKSLG